MFDKLWIVLSIPYAPKGVRRLILDTMLWIPEEDISLKAGFNFRHKKKLIVISKSFLILVLYLPNLGGGWILWCTWQIGCGICDADLYFNFWVWRIHKIGPKNFSSTYFSYPIKTFLDFFFNIFIYNIRLALITKTDLDYQGSLCNFDFKWKKGMKWN